MSACKVCGFFPCVVHPAPERIAAALELAKACDDYFSGDAMVSGVVFGALQAYRATEPKLRTRAEVDAEIVAIVRRAFRIPAGAIDVARLNELMAEPTQYSGPSNEIDRPPPVAATGAAFPCERCKGQGYTVSHSTRRRCDVTCGLCNGTGEDPRQPHTEPNPSEPPKSSDEEEAAIQAADHEDDQCGCDESERLNGYLKDIKALHRVWSDHGAEPFQTLTCVGHVLMRWMSNEP